MNSVERLTRHLNKGIPFAALKSYLNTICKWIPECPVIHIDDSDVAKPDGYKFEALGLVRDGSKSTSTKKVYEKSYPVTEACVLSKNKHPVMSVFFQSCTPQKKKISLPSITLPSPQSNVVKISLEKLLLL